MAIIDADVGVTLESLAAFPEPCAIVRRDGTLLSANRAVEEAVGVADRQVLSAQVSDIVVALSANGGGRTRYVVNVDDGPPVVYEIVVLNTANDTALVMFQDRTMDSSLRNALTESRARYRDLVVISSEHAWEVDATGAFSFVAPQGFVGHLPNVLIGHPASELIDHDRHVDVINPFTTPVPLTASEVWVRNGAGVSVCLEVAAVPLVDAHGTWLGARGVCRDVTEERERTALIAEARARERVLARIMRLFQREADPDSMIKAAASAITHGMAATGCQVFGLAAPLAKVVDQPRFHQEAAFGRIGAERAVTRLIADLRGRERGAVAGVIAERGHILGALTSYGDRINGALMVWREADRPDFSAADHRLLRNVAGQVGVALEQMVNHRVLVEVSRTDGLTGLFNRRAFYEDMQRRVRRLERGNATAALMYVDLDNFKQVNDIRGHEVGDAALKDVGELLLANTRSTDVVARLGGDEFAVWLDDADETVAAKRAEVFLAASSILRRYSGSAEKPLMLSIGVAIYSARYGEDINEFVSRADAAMYAIKRKGKGSYGIAPPPLPPGGRR
ncbi:MAG: sensor domain-containing diguanylate cyclase [Rhodospirillaceae bacterium]